MRLALGALGAVATLTFMAGSGCMTRAALSVPAQAPLAFRSPSAPVAMLADARVALNEPTWPEVTPVLDDARLAAVKELFVAADYAAAATALDAARVALQPTAEDDTRWAYQVGRLRQQAGDSIAAARSFDDAARRDSPLRVYAKLGAAQALLRVGQVEEAKLRADQVPGYSPAHSAAQLLVADALALRNDPVGAAALYDEYLASARHPARWIDVALRSAEAWLQATSDAAGAQTAARLARRVMVEAPTSPALGRALELHERALRRLTGSARAGLAPLLGHGKTGAMLPSDWAHGLSFDEQVARASALGDQQDYGDAERALDALANAMGSLAGQSETGCRAALVRGGVLGKNKERARAADAYGVAISRCESYRDALVDALYFGGKASASVHHCEEARVRFLRVETEFREHRFADDARLRGADCALELGDEASYAVALAAMPADYPEGDMAPEAMFRLALRKMSRGEWAAAVPVLDAAQALKVQEGPSSSGGRLAYFAARARLTSGDVEGGKRGLVNVIRAYPLSYYMLHAYARLSDLDRALAVRLLDDVLREEPPGALLEGESLLDRAGFVRALELLRQGATDDARRELAALGSPEPGNERALWAVAELYARAGLPQLSHAIPRVRLVDWLSHYPAGRWRSAWELAYPRAFSSVVEREAKKNGIPPSLAYAVMREESSFDPEAQSASRAYGLMQLIVPTAKRVGRDLGIACDENSLVQPETNVALGCRFLADLRAKFPNPHVAISAYNAGPTASQRWISTRETDDFDLWVERIPFDETRKYTKKVLASFAAYAFLYEKEALDSALHLPRTVLAP